MYAGLRGFPNPFHAPPNIRNVRRLVSTLQKW